MYNRSSQLVYALGTLVMGAALVLIPTVRAQATDAIDDPIRQPHLKSWSNVITNADRRFVVLADFNNAAVLDRETGLVWEKSPDTQEVAWSDATSGCLNKTVGGRKGWRLPAIPELTSLIDPTVPYPGPTLPAANPFTNAQHGYWSATTIADDPPHAWVVSLTTGGVTPGNKPGSTRAWCVRGAMNADTY
jgi:hypothetical protein